MNLLSKTLILFFCLISLFASKAFAEPLTSAQNSELTFLIGDEGVVFNQATVASANIVQEDNSDRCSVLITLNPYAAQQLEFITEKNIGKTAVLSFNGKVISSSTIQSKLSGQFQVVGLSKEEAKQFINSLS